MRSNLISLVLIVCLLFTYVSCNNDEIISEEFNIKPEGNLHIVTFKSHFDRYTLKFSYVCTGGSNEQWVVNIIDENGSVTFNIGRPSPPSYILFKDFEFSITDTKTSKEVPIASAELWDNIGVIPVNDQYIIGSKTKIKPSKNWGGNLALATIVINQ